MNLDEIVHIHADQIQRYGGSPGVRDLRLLESAIAMPQAGVGETYFHPTICDMAAAYLFHIVQNHPFVDGNKRVGAAAASVFFIMNDLSLNVDESDFEKVVMAVATGEKNKADVAAFFKKHARNKR